MILTSLRLRSIVGLLALILLGAAANRAAADPITLPAGDTVIVTHTAQGNVLTVFGPQGIPLSDTTITPGLFGSVNDLNFKTTKSGATRAKATVDLVNTSGTSLRNVTATVYLSNDNALSADDTKIVTLNLSDYVAKGKIPKYDTFSLPFNYKVPSVLKSYVNGKYLIVVLSASNLDSLETTPVVVGPITLP